MHNKDKTFLTNFNFAYMKDEQAVINVFYTTANYIPISEKIGPLKPFKQN